MIAIRPGLLRCPIWIPTTRVPSDHYDEIVREFSVDLKTYGVKRFFDSFDYVDAGAEMEPGFPMFSKIGRKEEVAETLRVTSQARLSVRAGGLRA